MERVARSAGRWVLGAALFVVSSVSWGGLQISEYAAKAGFLLKFTQYVEWPSEAFSSSDAAFQIGVFGSDPFGQRLEDTFQGHRVKGRPVVIRRVKNGADLTDLQILYVPAAQAGYASDIARQTKGRPILVVGESPNFCKSVGVINFFLDGTYIRFEISSPLARQGNLVISTKLLNVARIIQ